MNYIIIDKTKEKTNPHYHCEICNKCIKCKECICEQSNGSFKEANK